MTHLNVAVRVRPMSQRETFGHAIPVVEANGNIVSITNLKVPEHYAGDSRERVRRFSFDYCFGATTSQEQVFNVVNEMIGNAVKKKFHSCVLAYGQSSSGKTHTMMGFQEQLGLTPRLCERIFDYLVQMDSEEEEKEQVTISYLEIHNEKVNDLLGDSETATLRVREHPVRGTYVQGLKEYKAKNAATLLDWLKIGNKKRKVSATSVNPQSSRSHSVITLKCLGGVKLTLVDLAGSERSSRVHTKSTFWEGANINKSLVALGNVISSLADQSIKTSKGFKKRFIPYRDSVLTWLLKDTLGGNSQTLMIATVSPSSACYSETVNTLRFGHRAKQIVARPVANEDPKQKVIRDLKSEIVKLKQLLCCCKINPEEHLAQIEIKELTDEKTFKTDASTNTENNLRLEELIIDRFNNQNGRSIQKCALKKELTSNYFGGVNNVDKINYFINSILCTTLKNLDTTKSFNISRKKLLKAELESSLCSTEKLIPVMDVTSTNDDKPVVKLRRTYSVLTEKDTKSAKRYGSHEALSSKGEKMKKSNPTTLRKRSIDKSNSTLGKVESKVDSIRKMPFKPRSEIVAAVTQRLYSKVNRKEAATETEEVTKESKGTMAKPRLQDLTQRALRYYRRRHIETQTEFDTVLRVKDISTDVDDLKIETLQLKHMSASTDEVKLTNTGVNCNLFTFDSKCSGLKLTSSCGVQVDEDSKEMKQPQNLLSFTKYLRNKENSNKENVPNPIYTSSVNIHVSHNYLNGNKTDSISEDSLDEGLQNVSFPTPDLISNHNSLEQEKVNFANTDDIPTLYESHNLNVDSLSSESFTANSEIIPELYQAGISISPAYAPEVNVLKQPERCAPLKSFHPILSKPNVIKANDYEKVTINEPIILKSIMKQHYDSDSSDFSLNTFENVQDSLNYHKRVHFPKEQQYQDARVFEAMTNFLKEASALMANLSIVANKLDRPEQAHEFQVTLNDISEMVSKKINKKKYRKKKRNESPNFENTSCQTSPKRTTTIFTETEEFPTNKYEALVKNSCDRLEQLCSSKQPLGKANKALLDESVLHRFPQPFSISDWPDFSLHQHEDSSLESNPGYSDYGSLPRRKVKHKTFMSPSEYLRQLTTMRKQIIDTSRDELLNDHRLGFE